MKLHLPKLLRNAVLACITAVAGISTTVGTAAFTGGVVTYALVTPQVHAEYTWVGGSQTDAAEAWGEKDNWEGLGLAENVSCGSGPGASGNGHDLWDVININGGTEGVTIGSADSKVQFDGWLLRLNLSSRAVLYASTGKMQDNDTIKPFISVTDQSELHLTYEGGHFNTESIVVGSESLLNLYWTGEQTEKGNSALTIDLTGGGTMNIISDTARQFTGPITLKPAVGVSSTAGQWGTVQTGLTSTNVTLGNLTADLGGSVFWEKTDVAITAENYLTMGGMYNIVQDAETGAYSIVYAKPVVEAVEWNGGALKLENGTVCEGGKQITEYAAVAIKGETSITVADESPVLTSLTITGNDTVADFANGNAVRSAGGVSIVDGATLNLNTAALNEELVIVVDGEGSSLVLSNVGYNDDASKVYLKGDIKLQNKGVMELVSGAGNDGLHYGNANKIEISGEAELKLNNNRFTMQAVDEIVLNGGKISGSGEGNNGALDYLTGKSTIVSSGTSYINAPIKLRDAATELTFQVNDGTLTLSGFANSGEGKAVKSGNGELVISSVGSHVSAFKNLQGTTTINASVSNVPLLEVMGGTLVLTGTDALKYNGAQTINVHGGTLELNERQTVDSGNVISLVDGHITGTGGAYGQIYTVAFDIHNASTMVITSSGTSSIESGIGIRNAAGVVKFQVDEGTLTASGVVAGSGSLIKAGSGQLVLTAANTYAGRTKVEAGTLVIDDGASCNLGSAMTGAGNLNLKGALSIAADKCVTASYGSVFSDGANGYGSSMLAAVCVGDAEIDRATASLVIGDTTYTGNNIVVSGGKIGILSEGESDVYHVNTQVTYNPETMADVREFCINPGAQFTISDASVLARTSATNADGVLRLDNSGNTMSFDSESSFTGSVVVGSGTTVQLGHKNGLGVNYVTNKDRYILVEQNAVLGFCADMYYKVLLDEGSTYSNTSSNQGTGSMQSPYIELLGDATIHAGNQFGLRRAGSDNIQSTTLALNGHTLTKTGTAEFFLHKTALTAGTIDVQEGMLGMYDGGTGSENVDIKLKAGAELTAGTNGKSWKSLTLYGKTGAVKVHTNAPNNDAYNLTIAGKTTADVLLDKRGGATLTLNAAQLNAGATITGGTLSLQGATTLGGTLTIQSGATLSVADNVTVSLSGLGGFAATGASGIPTTNGLVSATGFKIVDDKNADNAHNNLTQVRYNNAEYTLDEQGCIAAAAKVYYAVESGVDKVVTVGGTAPTADTSQANEFYVGGNGTLKIAGNITDGLNAQGILKATGGTGTVQLSTSANLVNGDSVRFNGDLVITAGGDLRLGIAGEGQGTANKAEINLDSLAGIELAGGTLSMRAFAGNVGDVKVSSASTLFVVDASAANGVKDRQIIETLDLGANLELKAQWKTNVVVNTLTGSGDLTFKATNGDGLKRDLSIHSVAGFTGNIILEERSDNAASVLLTINERESLNASQITTCATSAVSLVGAGTYKLGAATALDSKLSLGSAWAGTVEITGASVTEAKDLTALNSNAGSKLALNGLTVADGGALTLGGAVSLGGNVSLAESIANNGTLNFADDIMLDLTGMTAVAGTGGVKVITLLTGAGSSNLAGLTAAVLSEATKALGTDWTFADNTITYKEIASDLYWEGGTGNWSNTSWSTTDGDTSNLVDFVADANAIFSGDTDCTISLTGNVSVASMKITGADYTFQRAEGNNAATITASSLEIGENASATFGNGSINSTVLSSISVAQNGVLDMTALGSGAVNYVTKIASGAGTVKLSGASDNPNSCLIAMGDTALPQGIGNLSISDYYGISGSNVADTTTSYTIGEGKSLVIADNKYVRIQQGAKVVLDGGSLTGGNGGYIQLGGDGDTTDNAYGHIEIKDKGTLTVSKIESMGSNQQNTFTMTGGTLEFTSAAGIGSGIATTITGGTLKATSASWSVTAAEVGGVIIETSADNSITLTDAKLTGTIDNTGGTLVLGGTLDIKSSGYQTSTTVTAYSDGSNGYATRDTYYQLATYASKLTVNSTSITLDGATSENLSLVTTEGDYYKWVRLHGTDFDNVYRVNEGTVTYNKDNTKFKASTTQILVNGGTLKLETSLAGSFASASNAIRIETPLVNGEPATTLEIGENATLMYNTLSVETGVDLGGEGVFDIGNTIALRSGVYLGDSWEGTVRIGNVGGANTDTDLTTKLNALGNSNSVVSISGNVYGYLNTSDSQTVPNGLTANVKLEEGAVLYINNGNPVNNTNPTRHAIVAGKLTGYGDIVFTGSNLGGNASANHKGTFLYTIKGDVSGWYGDFVNGSVKQSTINLAIAGNATTVNADIRNAADKNAESTLNLTIGDSTTASYTLNGEVAVDSLAIVQNTALNNSVSATTFSNSATTTLAATHEVTDENDVVTEVDNVLSLGALTNSGDLTVNGTLAVSGAVTNSGSLALAKDTTFAGLVTGGGKLTGTALTLQGNGTNAVGDLELTGALTLGTAEVASKLTAGALEVGSVKVNNVVDSLISASSLTGNLTFNIEESLLTNGIASSQNKSVTLLTLDTALTVEQSVLLGAFAEGGAAALKQKSSDGRYVYTLGWNTVEGKQVLTLTAKPDDSTVIWDGSGTVAEGSTAGADATLWSNADNWSSPVQGGGAGVPTADSTVLISGGVGSSRINVKDAQVQIANLTVEDWNGKQPALIGTTTGAGTLTIDKNLTVNSGGLGLALDATVKGDVVVKATDARVPNALTIESAETEVLGSLTNGGNLTVGDAAGMAVAGAVTNSGTIETDGTFTVGTAEQTAPAGVENSGTVAVYSGTTTVYGSVTNASAEGASTAAAIKVEGGKLDIKGSLANTGIMDVSGGTVTIGGNMSNTGAGIPEPAEGAAKAPGLDISGGTVAINGVLTNSDAVVVTGADTSLTIGANGTAATTASLVNTGSLKVDEGAEVTVNGSLDNTSGTIIIGTAAIADADPDTEGNQPVAATTGTLKVTGDLTGTGGAAKLVVNEDSELTVGGDLAASDVALAFGGDVTVGGKATVGNLTIEDTATFTAKAAEITGTLANNGEITVGSYDDQGNLVGDADTVLDINTLTGSGKVTVAEGGTLKINTATDFTGELKNLGSISVEQGVTISKKTDDGGNITAPTLTIGGLMKDVVDANGDVVIDQDTQKPVQKYVSANGTVLGDVATESIIIDTLDHTAGPHLTLGSLTGKLSATDTDNKVQIKLTELGSSEGVDKLIANGEKDYHLLSIGGTVSMDDLSLVDNLSDADEQKLWKSGLKLGDLTASSTMALRAASTNVSISVSNQTLAEATWDTAGETTKIGLDLGTLSNGTLVMLENNMLDKVQSVNVTTDVKLDLAATPNSLDTTVTAPVAVNINGLQGANKLTIAGSTQTEDTADIVNLNTLGDQFTGTVELTGKVTANMGAAADTAMKGATIVAMGDTVTLGGTLTGGELVVSQDSTANGNLVLANSDVKVVIAADGTTLSNERLAGPIADLDAMGMKSGAEGTVSIGTYDANGNFVKSLAYGKYYTNIRMEGSQVVGDRNTSYYSDALADKATSANGKAGLELADAALVNVNAQADKNSALGNAMDALDAMVATGNTGAADELGAALAGASTAVLGMAVSGDVERQLRAIRNRTTTMGVDQGVVNPEMPYYNAWINAEGGNNELRESGTAGGYKLSSWGGTVGFDVDFTPTFTAGMALTAMYGDLSVKGADQAKGDLDTYYVSAFARYCASAWTHTFVATAGLADMTLNRTVAGSEVEGDTNGLSFGLMYEVGRVFALNEDATACLQPIMNVTWRHTQVSGYTEKGSDLGLKVEDQTYDTITFGAGARLQAVVGESMFNRTSIFECRALIKVDAGDRNGTSEVALAGATAEVESAELGAVGLEAGAGITIPLGDEGSSIFADASIEVRSGYTNVNGTVGYRINF